MAQHFEYAAGSEARSLSHRKRLYRLPVAMPRNAGSGESLDQSVETVAPEVPAAGVNSHERLVRTGQAMKQEEVSMSQVRDSERVYLAVSYNERDAARAAGAKWDSIAKSWYAGPQADMEQLKRWLPENVKNEQLPAMTPREEFAEALRSVGCIVEGESIR